MYNIMHKNKVIAKADSERITEIICGELCPACFSVGMDIEYWLKSRNIDVHRSHSRQLYKALRLKSDADISEIINIGHGITITDNWWIQSDSDDPDYRALKEFNRDIASIALNGSAEKENFPLTGYTELGTIGSYEKAWRYINDSWYMFKRGNKAELISEYYAYCFLKQMNVPVAEYEIQRTRSELGIVEEYMITKDFTDNGKFDFEPFYNYFSDNEDFDLIIPRLKEIEHSAERSDITFRYVQMCFYDALLFNVDRHNFNAGFLRNSQTGAITGLAPCFDYNLCLASTKVPRFGRSGDLMRYFTENKSCMEITKSFFPSKGEIINGLRTASEQVSKVFSDDDFNYNILEKYIENAYEYCVSAFDDMSNTLDLTSGNSVKHR